MMPTVPIAGLAFLLLAAGVALAHDADSSSRTVPAPPPQSTLPAAAPAKAPAPLLPESTAPLPGIPIPMDLRRAETLRLSGVRVTVALGQHEAKYAVYCTLRCLGDPGQPVAIGLPLLYTPEKGLRKLPVSHAVTGIMASMNDMKVPFSLTEGAHPNADSPALADWAGVRYWITATVKPTHDNQVLVYTFSVPLAENGCVTPPQALFRLPYLAAWGGARAQSGEVEVYFSEIYPQDVRHNMAKARADEGGRLVWNFLDNGTSDGLNAMRIEVGGALSPDGKTFDSPMRGKQAVRLHASYKIEANGTGAHDPMGSACSVENLKSPTVGFWKSDGSRIPELRLTPDRPRRSLALVVRSGLAPSILGTVDPVARSHPETAFSLHARPSRVRVDINGGEKVYSVKLRDDWQPQLINLLDTGSPVRSVLLTIEQAYTGGAGSACYLQSIEWVDPAN